MCYNQLSLNFADILVVAKDRLFYRLPWQFHRRNNKCFAQEDLMFLYY